MSIPAPRPLADAFPPADEARWLALVEKARGGSAARLQSATLDGLPVGPVHPRRTAPPIPMRPPGAAWTVFQRIEDGDAGAVRALATAALKGGAGGIDLGLASSPATHGLGHREPEDVAALLGEIGDAAIRIDAGRAAPRLTRAMRASAVHCVFDPIAVAAAEDPARPLADDRDAVAALIAALDGEGREGTAFAADGRIWHDAGASEAQELAAVLASAVDMLRRLAAVGCDTATAARRLGVVLSADADEFLTIAKFRAARLLLARVAELADLGDAPPPIHAETAWRMLSRREPTINIVRTTVAAFAAAAGGADSITARPPLVGSGAFDARMARNTQLILGEESSLGRVADPAAGSGAIEALTGDLAEAAWRMFTRIEAEGGLGAAVRTGSVQRAVAAMRDARLDRVARRRLPLVGVNVNVDRAAPAAAFAARRRPAPPERLTATRLSEPIEGLCARTAALEAGLRRAVVVRGAAGDDASDAADALAAAGFAVEIVPAAGGGRVPAGVACVTVGSDDGTAPTDAADRLRAAGVPVVIAAAAAEDAVPPGRFDAIVTPDADLVALFSDVLDRIAETQENGQNRA